MDSNSSKSKSKNKPGQGRKPLGQERGGLVPLMVSVFADQAERLREGGNQSLVVRVCLDKFFSDAEKNGVKSVKTDR